MLLVVILAGGKSRRMGSDKASLPFRGADLLRYQIWRFQAAGFQVAVSGHEAPNVPILADIFPGRGPMAGLHAAFSQTGAEKLFLMAVDLPLASPDMAKDLLDSLDNTNYDACVIRREDGHMEPLFAAYRRSCFPAAEALLRQGQGKMRQLLEQVRTLYLSEKDLDGLDLDQMLFNVNRPEDYQSLLV